jgi:uncharacterized protein (TIGR03000 family)
MPKAASARPRYVDYYARNTTPDAAPAIASGISQTRYVDYYARSARPSADNKARLHVSLPADAELWLNGQRMKGTGPERDLITPQLKGGETYAYRVKARWTQDGHPSEETIEVKVRANEATTVRLGTSTLATKGVARSTSRPPSGSTAGGNSGDTEKAEVTRSATPIGSEIGIKPNKGT